MPPPPDLLADARAHLGGWVCEVHPDYDRDGAAPPHTIHGAWKVDDNAT
jgi:hypothetical protein